MFSYWLLFILSCLPDVLLYAIGDIAFVCLFYIFKYRKMVSFLNIKNSFPHYTILEIENIQKKFYKNLTDNFVETLILLSATSKKIDKMMRYDLSLFEQTKKNGENFYCLLGHQFNWEIVNFVLSKNHVYESFNIFYLPLQNKSADLIMRKMRCKFGSKLINAYQFSTNMFKLRNQQHSFGIIADQRPFKADKAYWFTFLNQKTPFMKEAEKSISIFNSKPFFVEIKKIKRGHYEIIIKEIKFDNNKDGDATLQYAKLLEQSIKEAPDNYLWTHKRWKFAFNENIHQNIDS